MKTRFGLIVPRGWATFEGWNPGLHDGPCSFAAYHAGRFNGELAGRPVSTQLCVVDEPRRALFNPRQ